MMKIELPKPLPKARKRRAPIATWISKHHPPQFHVGLTKDRPGGIWHTNYAGDKYWNGGEGHLTPRELYDHCLAIIRDLKINHPELGQQEATK